MISIDRLRNLSPDVFVRKSSLLVATCIHRGEALPPEYLNEIIGRAKRECPEETELIERIAARAKGEGLLPLKDWLDMRAGKTDVDFDYLSSDGKLSGAKREVRDRILVLDSIRSPYNLGAIARSAESFMVRRIIISGSTFDQRHPNAIRSSLGTLDSIEFSSMAKPEAIEFVRQSNLPAMALECGGKDINGYSFPDGGICVIGNEEFGISTEFLELCGDRISIPMFGSKGSLNLSVACGIMLQRWCSGTRHK